MTVSRVVVAQLTIVALAPGHRPDVGPLQHQVITGASVVVSHEVVGHPIVAQRHHLPLRQIAESTVDEARPGVVHYGQGRAGGGRAVQGEGHGVRRRIAAGGDWHIGRRVVAGRQCADGGDCHRLQGVEHHGHSSHQHPRTAHRAHPCSLSMAGDAGWRKGGERVFMFSVQQLNLH